MYVDERPILAWFLTGLIIVLAVCMLIFFNMTKSQQAWQDTRIDIIEDYLNLGE